MAGAPTPGMETRIYKGERLQVTTLPKGTVLFRGAKGPHVAKEDVFGIRGTTNYCMPPHYSVYFYPFPYVDSTVDTYSHILVYVVTRDIKILNLISPSTLTRAARNNPDDAITSCSNIPVAKYGCGLTGRQYDPCFATEFMEEHPDIVGMIAIAGMDQKSLVRELESPTLNPLQENLDKYISLYTDARGQGGVPELILYPRRRRVYYDVSTPKKTDLLEWYEKNHAESSYRMSLVFERSNEEIASNLESLISRGVLMIDKRTGFFVEKPTVESSAPLIEVKTGDEWNISKNFPEFRFKHDDSSMRSSEGFKTRADEVQTVIRKTILKESVEGSGKPRSKYRDHLAIVLAEIAGRLTLAATGCHYEMSKRDPENHGEEHTTLDGVVELAEEVCKEQIAKYTAKWGSAPETPMEEKGDASELYDYLPCNGVEQEQLNLTLQKTIGKCLSETTKDGLRMIQLASGIASALVYKLLLRDFDVVRTDRPISYAALVMSKRIDEITTDVANPRQPLVDDIFNRRMEEDWNHEMDDEEEEEEEPEPEPEPEPATGGTRRRRRRSTKRTYRRRLRYVRRRRAPVGLVA